MFRVRENVGTCSQPVQIRAVAISGFTQSIFFKEIYCRC